MKKGNVPRLLFSYSTPSVEVGQFVQCTIRGEVEVVKLSAGSIQWPIGRYPPKGRARFLIVMGDLIEAVRRESEEAVCHYWGVGRNTVWTWRKALRVSRTDNEGTRRLMHAAARKGADAIKKREWSEQEREQRRRQTIARGRNANITPGYNLGPWWTPEQLALLGTVPDEDLAKQLGRTTDAVRCQRTRRGIPSAKDRRRRRGG
jgi:hypothetical protein